MRCAICDIRVFLEYYYTLCIENIYMTYISLKFIKFSEEEIRCEFDDNSCQIFIKTYMLWVLIKIASEPMLRVLIRIAGFL